MSKILLFVAIGYLLSGCGGSDGVPVSSVSKNEKKSITKDFDLLDQEWHFKYNKSFFEFNKIDKDAHIHATKSIKRYGGKGIKIAVIDDNLDRSHPAIKNSIIETYDVDTNSTFVEPINGEISHGTAVVGIITSNDEKCKGIVPDAKIIFIKIPKILTDSAVIKAFEYARTSGADIISCSWGTKDVSMIVKEKIKDIVHNSRKGRGTTVVFASGNNSQEIPNDESAIEDVIGVGSTNKYNKVAFYSNYGEALDVVAPGGEYIGIPTLDISGSKGFSVGDYLLYNDKDTFIGTSASVPIVSSLVAMMLEKNPNLTVYEIYEILKNSSDKLDKYYGINGHSKHYGYGKVNVDKAMSLVK